MTCPLMMTKKNGSVKAPTSFQTESQHESCNQVHGLSHTSFAIPEFKGLGWRFIWHGIVTQKLGSEESSANTMLWWYDIAVASYTIGTM